jgi:hypothetical protein
VLPAPQLIFPGQHAAGVSFWFYFAAVSDRLKLIPDSSGFISPDFRSVTIPHG